MIAGYASRKGYVYCTDCVELVGVDRYAPSTVSIEHTEIFSQCVCHRCHVRLGVYDTLAYERLHTMTGEPLEVEVSRL